MAVVPTHFLAPDYPMALVRECLALRVIPGPEQAGNSLSLVLYPDEHPMDENILASILENIPV